MRLRAQTVEDDTGQIDLRVIIAEPLGNRRSRGPHGLDIKHEDHRRLQQLRDFCRRADALTPAIIESHDALYDRNISSLRLRRKKLRQGRARHKPAVEVMRRPAAGHRMIAGVDIIRADLERLHDKSLLTQSR